MTRAHPTRRFGSTEHLASEAVAAYVDGELRMNAYLRAAEHLAVCPECAAEVEAQQQARRALRDAARMAPPPMPSTLLGALADIPQHHRNLSAPGFEGMPAADRYGSAARRWPIRWRR
ncbi:MULTISPECIES: zf-HC2 domain-containing protein [Rhodococcus]|uniref:RNA polymerase subunit sigma-70 n=1 Tax=Rhodococcus rhodochrous KG-21 TaxID=1441923 RepID=A0A0M8PPW0_RHORH|nr:zf-HC2 domain-containing protein [Rhodococcus rhodochrous]KOS56649.1 RNA polymerase subunit sigma-70 [Rhodococcus rhodochrous KG-21]